MQSVSDDLSEFRFRNGIVDTLKKIRNRLQGSVTRSTAGRLTSMNTELKKNNMNKHLLFLSVIPAMFVVSSAWAAGGDGVPQRNQSQQMLQNYDVDNDGRLSAGEKEVARVTMKGQGGRSGQGGKGAQDGSGKKKGKGNKSGEGKKDGSGTGRQDGNGSGNGKQDGTGRQEGNGNGKGKQDGTGGSNRQPNG
ncbi:MAG: hypothetical protein DRP71_01590 [Verrucomicrobia bacterium]|nr:MAG: hypothetical protein DRP71_01590 [Verrucomicrobiota bacterium]